MVLEQLTVMSRSVTSVQASHLKHTQIMDLRCENAMMQFLEKKKSIGENLWHLSYMRRKWLTRPHQSKKKIAL